MGFKDAMRTARRTDTLPTPPTMPHDVIVKADGNTQPASLAEDADMAGRLPKRSASFGRSFGGIQAITSSMTRKSTGEGSNTPPGAQGANPSAATNGTMAPPSVPESSHLAQFSLKLSELINKAFMPCTGTSSALGGSTSLAGVAKAAAMTASVASTGVPALSTITYEGRKLPSKAVVSEIALLIVAELEYAASVDPYLLRAVSRQALKALTPFADRMDSLVVQPSKDASATQMPTTAKEGAHISSALEYNLGLVTIEYIVEDSLERCIEGPPDSIDEGMPAFVSEILTPVRKKMESTILHVIQPILNSAKSSLMATISKAVLTPFAGYGQNLSPVPSNGPGSVATPSIGAMSPPLGPSASVWLKELEGKVDGIRKVLVPRLADRCGQDGEGWYISVVIYAIWKGLLFLTSRSVPVPNALSSKFPAASVPTSLQAFAAEVNKRAPSPAQITSALKSVSVVGRARKANDGIASGASTPSSVFQNAGFSTSAHANSSSTLSRPVASQIHDMQGFERIMRKFAAGFTCQEKRQTASSGQENDDSSESDSDDEDELARAALTEALQAIRSTITVAHWLDIAPRSVLIAAGRKRGRTMQVSESCQLPVEVVHAAKAIPSLLLLHLVHARMPTNLGVFAIQSRKEGGSDPTVPSPHAAFGYTWATYEKAISGFAGGQTWANALAAAWREDIEEAWTELEARSKSKEVIATAINIKSSADFTLQRSPSVTSSERDALGLSDASQSQESLTSSPKAIPVDASDSTPTPASVMQQRARISPSASATASSDSLPEHMTQSAPTLNREREQTVVPRPRASSPAEASLSSLAQEVHEAASGGGGGKDRPTWTFMRKISRKQSGSDTNSPPRQLSPKTSPPLTPNVGPTQDLRAGGTQTSARRFWRTPSSQNVAAAGSGAAVQGTSEGRSSALHLPSLNPLRGHAAPSTAAQNVTVSDEDRQRDETRLEAACLRLLSTALDAVEGTEQAQTLSNDNTTVATVNPGAP